MASKVRYALITEYTQDIPMYARADVGSRIRSHTSTSVPSCVSASCMFGGKAAIECSGLGVLGLPVGEGVGGELEQLGMHGEKSDGLFLIFFLCKKKNLGLSFGRNTTLVAFSQIHASGRYLLWAPLLTWQWSKRHVYRLNRSNQNRTSHESLTKDLGPLRAILKN